jgi:glycerol uptake facilitator-like aquaporin
MAQLLVYTLLVHPAAQIIATLLVWMIIPASSGLGGPMVGAGFTTLDAFGFEVVGSTMLVFVFYMLFLWRPRASPSGLLAHVEQCDDPSKMMMVTNHLLLHPACCPSHMFGMAFGALSLAGSLVSGASFDWYRHLWPAVFSTTVPLEHTWIYLVGPLLGAFIARVLLWIHRMIFLSDVQRVAKDKKLVDPLDPAAALKDETHEA